MIFVASKNLCAVDTLGSVTENTNVIAEENGTLVRLNLYDELAILGSEIDDLNTKLVYHSVIPDSSDLDDFVEEGVYFCSSGASAATIVNTPVTNNGFRLEVKKTIPTTENNRMYQVVYVNFTEPITFKRVLSWDGWSAWKREAVPHSLNKEFSIVGTANTFIYVGSVSIPPSSYFTITARGIYNNTICDGIAISTSSSSYKSTRALAVRTSAAENFPSCTYSDISGSSGLTYYIWARWQGATTNTVNVTGFYIPMGTGVIS